MLDTPVCNEFTKIKNMANAALVKQCSPKVKRFIISKQNELFDILYIGPSGLVFKDVKETVKQGKLVTVTYSEGEID